MNLGELIDALETVHPDTVTDAGFCHPHSYRGYYHELSFAPCGTTTAGEMLQLARWSVGRVFSGWKGGDFLMSPSTKVWVSPEGQCSVYLEECPEMPKRIAKLRELDFYNRDCEIPL